VYVTFNCCVTILLDTAENEVLTDCWDTRHALHKFTVQGIEASVTLSAHAPDGAMALSYIQYDSIHSVLFFHIKHE